MPIVQHLLSFNAGEWSPILDGRADLEKYQSAARVLENFIPTPQGALLKRPGMTYQGKMGTATDCRLVEFEMRGDASVVLAIGGGKIKFFKLGAPVQSGGADYTINAPWADGTLNLLRWKQINDIMMLVHPDHAPRILERIADTNWTLANFIPARWHAFLPDNLDGKKRITATFKRNADATTWTSGADYEPGDRVTRNSKLYCCENAHEAGSSNKPEDRTTYYDAEEEEQRLLWTLEYNDNSSTQGQRVTLTSNKALWNSNHVGAYWELAFKRGLWDFEARLAVDKTATGTNAVYSKVLVCQGRWTFQTFGNWSGTYHVQISRDKGKNWSSIRAFTSSKSTPRNASAEGETDARVLLRIRFSGYAADGTSGSPYAILNVEGPYLRGIVRIDTVTSSKEVVCTTITPVEHDTTSVWAEGAWSAHQGYPRAIEFHQNRVLLAGTRLSPHTIWGSAVDDYDNFRRGTDADEAFAHTVMIGQREPISWLLSDRSLVIGAGNGEFVMRGESEDKPITPEFGVVARQSAHGSAVKGPGVIPVDSSTLFVQYGGSIVREMAYRYDADRYDSGNLNLLADHLFKTADISDFAVQRHPFQILWFVAGGKLYSLTYERAQQVAAWARHPTAGTVLSVACIRKSIEDEVWVAMQHGSTETIERMRYGHFTNPTNDGKWSDCCMVIPSPYSLTGNPLAGLTVIGWNNGNIIGPATLDAGFFTGLTGDVIVGRPYTAALQPMPVAIEMQNGSSRTRETRIHEVVASVWRSLGGKIGEDPAGSKFDPLRLGSSLFTGEKAVAFDGKHGTTGNVAVVSDEPFPFTLRSLALKFNVFGDAR
ncbi:MAG: hypothetical protein MUC40_00640 [Akkermansiaceae bacterium]|jgi:hypothetical protein|nr:hypothetical protein [Akkermansiaceae bacterium]